LNTARWGPEGVLAVIQTGIEAYDHDTDEGAAPVTGVEYDFG
jgi:cytidylate kinase